MLDEIWKDIPEYEGFYQASSLGRIRNIQTDKILKPTPNHHNYLRVILWKGLDRKDKGVHQLVCLTFVGSKPFEEAKTLHRDGNNQNNIPDNLFWGTTVENNKDPI